MKISLETRPSLRVAMVCDWCLPRFGGLELQLRDLSSAMAAGGHSVEILTSTPGPDQIESDIPSPAGGKHASIRVHRLPGVLMPGTGLTFSTTQFAALRAMLSRKVREGQLDVVHIHSGVIAPLAYGAALISARMGLPTALTFHSVYSYLLPGLRMLAVAGAARRLPIAWSAVSTRVARETSHALGGATVELLPNGIAPDRWSTEPSGRSPAEFRLVTAMRLQVRKRPRALFSILDAAQASLGPSIPLTLDIIGDGPDARDVHALAARAGPKRVRVHGCLGRDEIRAIYSASDAFLLPSTMESFGIAALEAVHAGLPVVARCGNGMDDYIEHGVNGLLGNSDAALAAGVVSLASDARLRDAIADRNRRANLPYSWDHVVTATLGQYDRAKRLQQVFRREDSTAATDYLGKWEDVASS